MLLFFVFVVHFVRLIFSSSGGSAPLAANAHFVGQHSARVAGQINITQVQFGQARGVVFPSLASVCLPFQSRFFNLANRKLTRKCAVCSRARQSFFSRLHRQDNGGAAADELICRNCSPSSGGAKVTKNQIEFFALGQILFAPAERVGIESSGLAIFSLLFNGN